MLFLKILLLICITLLTYMALHEIENRLNRKVREAQNKRDRNVDEIRSKVNKIIYSNKEYASLFNKIETRLIKQGNPLNLNLLSYFGIKFSSVFLISSISIFSKNNLIVTIAAAIISFFFIDVSYYIRNKNDIQEIKFDLPDLTDMLNIQFTAGVKLSIALTEIYDIPKNKRLQKELLKLSADIELNKNPDKALIDFVKKFDIAKLPEINNFVVAIRQALKTGRVEEILDNQSEVLKEDNLERIKSETKQIDVQIGVLIALVFVGVITFIIYCFGSQLTNSVKSIFN